jgi:hypothetical protein
MMLNWRGFVWIALGGFGSTIALLAVFVLLMNPYGNLPQLLFREHAIADENQRFQYPALIRSGRFDSIVIGTSSARLIDPEALERIFGGRFANLSMNAARAWEQYRLADLYIRTIPAPRTLMIALDNVWCHDSADTERETFRGFPEWMYDDNRWNDLAFMLNAKSVEISGRRLAVALGRKSSSLEAGYEVFTPPESAYDPVKVRKKLWGIAGPEALEANEPPYAPSSLERASWRFPALAWLDEILVRFRGRVVLVFMPAHIAAQPPPGSEDAARESECKARIAAIARRRGVSPVIDFRIRSEITSNDANYWDKLHYRLGIADRLVSGIERALKTGMDDPNGDWRLLEAPNVEEGVVSSTTK